MYNPPPPPPGKGAPSYYRQPNSTPGVANPVPNAQFIPPPPSQQQQQPPYAPSAPQQQQGQYNMPPPPQQMQQQQQAGQYGSVPVQPQSGPGISLSKDQTISLNKEDPYLRKVHVGLGWDPISNGAPFDLDAVVFMLGPNGMVRTSQDFIFYNNKQSRDGSVFHHGDNLTGQGDGDDEVVSVNLQAVSPDVTRLVFAVTIHQSVQRRQNFSMVPRAFIRIANQETGRNICRYDLTTEGGMNDALICGEVFRDNSGQWSFIAVGKSFNGSLGFLTQIFGVNTTQ